MDDAVIVEGLRKSFGNVHALDGVSFTVPRGTVLGLLGPNGAGKTTAVRIITTLLQPDGGRAVVAGLDVVTQAAQLRARIGLTGQYAAVDGQLTGRENLILVGTLYHLPRATARRRADELLEQFDLTDAATRPSKTYSGGMRRRLDLAASLVNRPEVLFLDEPTTGLDPRSRIALWDVIADLVKQGTSLLLTTQYLEEADRLADRIAVIDLGKVIAEGTSDELKDRVGGDFVELRVADPSRLAEAVAQLAGVGSGPPVTDPPTGRLSMPTSDGSTALVETVRRLDAAGVEVFDLGLRRPTLDDVFLSLTGHAATTVGEQTDRADVVDRGVA
jgi:ABC-2 type transport system ATP-binding protein